MRIFVLGAGAAGALLARLLERQGHTVWCGDRDLERARRSLPASIPCRGVNARNLWGIVRAARGCHLLVNAAPAAFNHTVLRAALRLREHYFDMATQRGGAFRLARRAREPEGFHCPRPIGRARVVRVAQAEAGTLPYFIPMRELD